MTDLTAQDLTDSANVLAAALGSDHPAVVKLDAAAVAASNEEYALERQWEQS